MLKGVSVASVDVFDSVLMRTVADPSAVFFRVGEVCAGQLREFSDGLMDPAGFRRARMQGEARARAYAPGGEPTLDEILREAGMDDPAIEAELKACELAIEQSMLRVVPGCAAWLDRWRDAGGRIIFTSDTYLTETELGQVLDTAGLLRGEDIVLTSCTRRRSKASGGLFEDVKLAAGYGRQVVHIGDNPWSDGIQAERSGLRSVLLSAHALSRHELELLSGGIEWSYRRSALAGIGRLTRLSISAEPGNSSFSVAMFCGVAAPLLAAYTAWCLHEAERLSLERLAFVSRDGEVLLRIARVLRHEAEPVVSYLYGSRQAWHVLPLATEWPSACPTWFTDGCEASAGAYEHAARAGVELEAVGWGAAVDGRSARFAELERIWSDDAFRSAARCRAADQLSAFGTYLEDEGLPQSKWGVVDVGWHGRVGASLDAACRHLAVSVPAHLYIGLESVPPTRQRASTWLFTGPEGALRWRHESFATVCEIFCAGTHGQVLGYERVDGGRIAPKLDADLPRNNAWGTPLLHACAERFARYWRDADFDVRLLAEDTACVEVVARILRDPLPDEAAILGSFPYQDAQGAGRCVDYAPPRRLRNVWSRRSRWQASFWPEGSVCRSPAFTRSLLGVRRGVVRTLSATRRGCGSGSSSRGRDRATLRIHARRAAGVGPRDLAGEEDMACGSTRRRWLLRTRRSKTRVRLARRVGGERA